MTVSRQSEATDLEQMLAVLSENERLVMVLAYGYGMSHSEIHRTTGIATGTVKSHIHRGKAKIRNAFAIEEVGYG